MIFLNTKRPGGNVNIFSHLFGSKGQSLDEVDAEPTAEELKQQRIDFHRRSVRNGPVKFSQPTNGQIRRAEKRRLARQQSKAYRAEVKNYHEKQRIAMYLRGQLQIAGVMPYIDQHEVPLGDQIAATGWIVQRYGVEVTAEDGTGTGHVSFRRGDIIDAMRNALKFYTSATGHVVSFPTNYEPAIFLAEEDVA